MAPRFTAGALEVFKSKVNVRILQIDLPAPLGASPAGGDRPWDQGRNFMDMKRIGSGILLQTADNHVLQRADLKVVTKRAPTEQEIHDLVFAWKVAKFVKSNAIVYAKDKMTIGVGAGQMSRVNSARRDSKACGSSCASCSSSLWLGKAALDSHDNRVEGKRFIPDSSLTRRVQRMRAPTP